ncbi:hypothetical protein ACIRU3_45985 [Streptomyces sp. NPDC101151]|uniref:hypothetical protein n=1 Tax=Streptomyces sp. NPDC101151 TaxID=3366115 RepID=UPI00381718CA
MADSIPSNGAFASHPAGLRWPWVLWVLWSPTGALMIATAFLGARAFSLFDTSLGLFPGSYTGPVTGMWMAAGRVLLPVVPALGLLGLIWRQPERTAETARVQKEKPAAVGRRLDRTVPR